MTRFHVIFEILVALEFFWAMTVKIYKKTCKKALFQKIIFSKMCDKGEGGIRNLKKWVM